MMQDKINELWKSIVKIRVEEDLIFRLEGKHPNIDENNKRMREIEKQVE